MMKKKISKKQSNKKVGNKISEIMHEGIRKNTRKPVSKSNPRRKVSQRQAIAVALDMKRKGKI